MFSFIHTYTPYSWDGMIKNGLVRPGDGLKIMHKVHYPYRESFNVIARPGTPLYNTVKDLGGPFYIDRLQGGVSFPWKYEYDKDLLHEYRQMLGDNFWGFQFHEWASNYNGECERINRLLAVWLQENPGKTENDFWDAVIKNFDEKFRAEDQAALPAMLYEESFCPEEYKSGLAKHTHETWEEFLRGCTGLYRLRTEETAAPVFPADSYFPAPKIEAGFGAQRLMPEVGWQIGGTRIQMAYTRGMARAFGIPFGIYYESWCCAPEAENGKSIMSVSYSVDSPLNEWLEFDLMGNLVPGASQYKRENGGSSLSLQTRLWLYAYFSGAEFIGEEYGVCNHFYDYEHFELSRYGKNKKEFLALTERLPDIGTPFTPFAVVLPAEMPAVDLNCSSGHEEYMGFPLAGSSLTKNGRKTHTKELSEKIRAVNAVFERLFTRDEPLFGNEAHVLRGSAYPDVFDIVHADNEEALGRYDYLIDCTGDAAFAARHRNIIAIEDICPLLKKLLPFSTDGKAHYAINRTADGWLVLVMNNNGVLRTCFEGDRFLSEAALDTALLFTEHREVKKIEGNGILTETNNGYSVHLGAGEWALLTINI